MDKPIVLPPAHACMHSGGSRGGNSGGSRGGKGGASVPPFGLHLTLRSTDDKLNGTPLSGYRSKKTAAMAHLRML